MLFVLFKTISVADFSVRCTYTHVSDTGLSGSRAEALGFASQAGAWIFAHNFDVSLKVISVSIVNYQLAKSSIAGFSGCLNLSGSTGAWEQF